MQNYTLHTHTVRFDGKNNVNDMVVRAKDLGFNTIGFSNHFIVHPAIKYSVLYHFALMHGYFRIYSSSFREAIAKFKIHYREIEEARKLYPEMRILSGMEVDFFDNDEWKKQFEETITILKPDYLIGSAHLVESDGLLLNTHDWEVATPEKQKIILEKYWTNVANAAASGLFNWMAHLDLPKKAGLGLEKEWTEFENRAVFSAAKSNTAIEINTSSYDRCGEPYPSNRILNMVKQHDVPVLLSDDAHNTKNIGRHFDKGQQLIKDLQLKTCELGQLIR